MKARRACELCGEEAALHCESDSAYLCWACDACVHGANFLVARHARRLLCHSCGDVDSDRRQVSGPGFLPLLVVCRSCGGSEQMEECDSSSDSGSESSSCCSSSCISSTGSGAAACGGSGGAGISSVSGAGSFPVRCGSASNTRPDSGKPCRMRRQEIPAAARRDLEGRTEGLLRIWCLRMGLDDARATSAAVHALGVGARRMAAVPFRVTVAAAVWSAAKLCCSGAGKGGRRREEPLLRRLEACSGVPATMILVAEAKLSRAVRSCHVAEEKEEGWAECA